MASALYGASCTRWSPQPLTPDRAFAADTGLDVAVRLWSDSTHWWRVRHARLVNDTIVGLARVHGHLRVARVPRDAVELVVVREPYRDATQTLVQFCLLGMLALMAATFPLFGWRGGTAS